MILAWCCWREICSCRSGFPCHIQQLFPPVFEWVVAILLHCFWADRCHRQTASCKAVVLQWTLMTAGCQFLLPLLPHHLQSGHSPMNSQASEPFGFLLAAHWHKVQINGRKWRPQRLWMEFYFNVVLHAHSNWWASCWNKFQQVLWMTVALGWVTSCFGHSKNWWDFLFCHFPQLSSRMPWSTTSQGSSWWLVLCRLFSEKFGSERLVDVFDWFIVRLKLEYLVSHYYLLFCPAFNH